MDAVSWRFIGNVMSYQVNHIRSDDLLIGRVNLGAKPLGDINPSQLLGVYQQQPIGQPLRQPRAAILDILV